MGDVCGKLLDSPDSKVFIKFENLLFCRMFSPTMNLCHSLARSKVVTMTTTRYSKLELKLAGDENQNENGNEGGTRTESEEEEEECSTASSVFNQAWRSQ